MMMEVTSQEKLSSLEHAKCPAVESLDQVATILGLQHDSSAILSLTPSTRISSQDGLRLRHQWVLRWLTKHLSNATKVQSPGDWQRLVNDARTWLLLVHLLTEIPHTQSKSILLDRDFCQTLGHCLDCLQRYQIENSGSMTNANVEAGRPRKRQRRSDVVEHTRVSPAAQTFVSVITVVSATAHILSGAEVPKVHGAVSPVRLANTYEAAFRFLGQLFHFSLSLIEAEMCVENSKVELVVALEEWLRLWQVSKPVIPKQAKHDEHQLFNRYMLRPTLRMRDIADELTRSLVRNLEKQAAVHTVLPARAAYQAILSPTTLSNRKGHRATNVSEVLHAVGTPLSDNLGNQTLSAKEATNLLIIAGRLIPRVGHALWRSEMLWLEAYWVSLLGTVFILQFQDDHTTGQPLNIERSISISASRQADLQTLLIVLHQTVDQCTSQYWDFFLDTVFTNHAPGLSTTTLSHIVAINAAKFVPAEQSSNTLLEKAISHADTIGSDTHAYDCYLEQILLPIFHECVRSRRTAIFYTLWHNRLHALHTSKARYDEQNTQINIGERIWADPRLFEAFAMFCHEQPPLALFGELYAKLRAILSAAETGLSDEAAASLEIFNALLRGVTEDPSIVKIIQDDFETLLVSTVKTLRADPKGHSGWLLWQLLDIVLSLSSQVPQEHLVMFPIPFDICPPTMYSEQLHRKYDPPALLTSFWAYKTARRVGYRDSPSLIEPTSQFDKTFQDLLETISKQTEEAGQMPVWNGSATSIDTASKLFSAFLGSFVQNIWWCATLPAQQRDLLLELCIRLCLLTDEPSSHDGPSIAAQCAGLLSAYTTYFGQNVLHKVIETCNNPTMSHKIKSLSILLHQVNLTTPITHQSDKLIRSCLAIVTSTKTSGHSRLLGSCLALIKVGLETSSQKQDHDIDTAALLSGLEGHVLELGSDDLIEHFMSLESLTTILIRRLNCSANPQSLEILLKRLRKLLKKQNMGTDTFSLSCSNVLLLNLMQQLELITCLNTGKQHTKSISKVYDQLHASTEHIVRYIEARSEELHTDFANVLFAVAALTSTRDQESRRTAIDFCKNFATIVQTSKLRDEPKALQLGQLLLQRLRSIGERDMLSEIQTFEGPVHESLLFWMITYSMSNTVSSTSEEQVAVLSALSGRQISPQIEMDLKGIQTILKACAVVRKIRPDHLLENKELLRLVSKLAGLQDLQHEAGAMLQVVQLESCNYLLMSKLGVVNQDMIDNVLASIGTSASTISKSHGKVGLAHIFDHLCSVLLTVLVRHRRRLLDRYHLLIPTLQKMLLCFFLPQRMQTISATLSTTSATKFTRVLETLTNPSASAAQSALHNSRPQQQNAAAKNLNLVDDVKAVRRGLSFHLQYLVQSFVQASLEGQLTADVREKLLPGLYAVIGTMDAELMRAMNAAMTESQRSIWKDLYQQWTRFGKWNQR